MSANPKWSEPIIEQALATGRLEDSPKPPSDKAIKRYLALTPEQRQATRAKAQSEREAKLRQEQYEHEAAERAKAAEARLVKLHEEHLLERANDPLGLHFAQRDFKNGTMSEADFRFIQARWSPLTLVRGLTNPEEFQWRWHQSGSPEEVLEKVGKFVAAGYWDTDEAQEVVDALARMEVAEYQAEEARVAEQRRQEAERAAKLEREDNAIGDVYELYAARLAKLSGLEEEPEQPDTTDSTTNPQEDSPPNPT